MQKPSGRARLSCLPQADGWRRRNTALPTLDALSLERLRYGAHLAKRSRLPILLSGGEGEDDPPLSELMARVLEDDYGLRARWLEGRSKTTAENAVFSAAMLRSEGIHCVVLVTHAWHMPRARAAFAANGMSVIPAPTAFYQQPSFDGWQNYVPNSNAFRMSGYAFHEIVGRLWYAVRYGYR